jgi:hypothetical protein
MVSRGYDSLSSLSEAASYIAEIGRPAFLYHFSDYDPSGHDAAAKIASTLRELAPDAEITFTLVAVLPWQIEALRLPTKPTRATDSRAKSWTSGEGVGLDAIQANTLRKRCNLYIDWRQLAVLQEVQRSERDLPARGA